MNLVTCFVVNTIGVVMVFGEKVGFELKIQLL